MPRKRRFDDPVSIKKLLKSFEEEYKRDLGVHLYSAHLMHTQTPSFPRAGWSAWPLGDGIVPRPHSSLQYTDEPEVEREKQVMSKAIPPRTGIRKEFLSEELVHEDEEIIDPDPREALEVELERLYKRKVYAGIHRVGHKKFGIEPSVDMEVPKEVLKRLTTKLDVTIEPFGNISNVEHHRAKHSFNWADILLESGVNDPTFLDKMHHVFIEEAHEFLEKMTESDQEVEGESEEDTQYSDRSIPEMPLDELPTTQPTVPKVEVKTENDEIKEAIKDSNPWKLRALKKALAVRLLEEEQRRLEE